MNNRTCGYCQKNPPSSRRAKYCSPQCVADALSAVADGLSTPIRRELRSASSGGQVVTAIRRRCQTTAAGCWEWSGATNKGGYGTITGAYQGDQLVHRITFAATYGPIGNQTIHHVCANKKCVNPDHLRQVTNRENVAEMLARQDYIRRIRLLEQALAEVAPRHPLLDEAPLGGVAS